MRQRGRGALDRLGTDRRAPFVVFALAVATYLPALWFGFAFDDGVEIVDNRFVRSWSHLGEIFSTTSWAGADLSVPLYRPVTTLSYLVNHALAGYAPWSWHLVNALLHGAVAALTLLVARRWHLPAGAALLGAALFAILPVHVEAVANVAGRKDLLAALFLLALLLAHPRALERGGAALALPGAWLALALLSKELAAVGPALVALQDAGSGGAERRPARTTTLYASYFAVLALWYAARLRIVGGLWPGQVPFVDNPIAGADTATRLLTAAGVAARGLFLQALPLRLTPDYSFAVIRPLRSPAELWAIAGLASACLLLTLLVVFRRRKLAWLLAGFYALSLLPASNLLTPIGSIFGERFLYLPSVATSLAGGLILAAIAARWPGTAGQLPAIAVLALALARTETYLPAWRSDETLFAHAVGVVPESTKAHVKWGEVCAKRGRPEEAVAEFRRALTILPGEPTASFKLAMHLDDMGRLTEAEPFFRVAMADPPRNANALHGIGVSRRLRGNLGEAAVWWSKALVIDPDFAPALGDLGSYYLVLNDVTRAIALLEQATSADPLLATGWFNLALAYDRSGQSGRAALARQRFENLARQP